jgi:hypothetical protein
MSEAKKIASGEVEAIAANVLRPGTEMSRVYHGLFEALMILERRLDAIEQQTKVGSDFARNLGKHLEAQEPE